MPQTVNWKHVQMNNIDRQKNQIQNTKYVAQKNINTNGIIPIGLLHLANIWCLLKWCFSDQIPTHGVKQWQQNLQPYIIRYNIDLTNRRLQLAWCEKSTSVTSVYVNFNIGEDTAADDHHWHPAAFPDPHSTQNLQPLCHCRNGLRHVRICRKGKGKGIP